MINLIPFAMVPIALWMHRHSRSNLSAVLAFIFIYAASLLCHELLYQNEFIFIINIMAAATLTTAIKRTCKKASLSIVLTCLTCFALTILNGIAFIAYNHYQDGIYQATLGLMSVFVGLQWAALWIKDDRIINSTGLHGHISRYILDRASVLVHRSKA